MTQSEPARRIWRFWLIFLALCVSLFLTALDLASVGTALPSIVHDLNGTDSFVWVSSAYTLACTAVLPMSGRLADLFGRRGVLLAAILLFGAGSAVAGAARSMAMLIAGRTIQGIGSGAIQVLVAIVIADLVPLKDRGFFQALTGATFSFASAIGPFIGGAITQRTTWRWLFYLNLPLCGIAFGIVFLFLRLRKPAVDNYLVSIKSMDWIGNTVIIGSATSCMIAITWAGVSFPWASVQVIVPLAVGLVGFAIALLYDAYIALYPVIPAAIIKNRTSIAGYIGSFFHYLVLNSVVFYLPAYFQSSKLAPPLISGLYLLPTALCISPSATIQGIIVSRTGTYRLITVVGWAAMLIGVGLMTLLDADSSIAMIITVQVVAAVGIGLVYATTFTVMAPLEPIHNASALSFLLFVRTLSSAWAIPISATILQNELRARLPSAFLATIPPGHDLAYSAIPAIPALPELLQREVRDAFAESFQLVWRVMLGFCGAGLASVALQKHVPLHTKMDERWGLEEEPSTERVGARTDEELVCGKEESHGLSSPAGAVSI
ncbi:iron permease [Cubamyces sp. BRFM 1775]|nr:iron permease [Cubamyces sp. BRFM 1775]